VQTQYVGMKTATCIMGKLDIRDLMKILVTTYLKCLAFVSWTWYTLQRKFNTKVGLVFFTADKAHGHNPVEGSAFPWSRMHGTMLLSEKRKLCKRNLYESC